MHVSGSPDSWPSSPPCPLFGALKYLYCHSLQLPVDFLASFITPGVCFLHKGTGGMNMVCQRIEKIN